MVDRDGKERTAGVKERGEEKEGSMNQALGTQVDKMRVLKEFDCDGTLIFNTTGERSFG